MTKRQRPDSSGWWNVLRDHVISNGGYVHSALEFSESDRLLSLRERVDRDEVLLQISAKTFMTKERAFSMCNPWLEAAIDADSGTNSPWHHSQSDLAIAVAMASCDSPDDYLYLHSLPDSSAFDALPRRWGEKNLSELLDGTSVFHHVLSAKKGVAEDYQRMSQHYQKWKEHEETLSSYNTQKNSLGSFPTAEKFSDMLAAVTSRAFQIGDSHDDVAIIPLLDLGNHTRGKTTQKLYKKNVSYDYDATKEEMIVRSTVDIDAGDFIRLTYGAKANAQLLLNYGFCIPHNLEPDGSSNDILEFQAGLDGKQKKIDLRAGPKSYSYGGFASALEEYFRNEDGRVAAHLETDDLEDFLNECENGEDDDDEGAEEDFMDLYSGKTTDSGFIDGDSEHVSVEEIEALEKFEQDLVKLSEGYKRREDHIQDVSPLDSGSNLLTVYSNILVVSELRTIWFFLRAIEKVKSLVQPTEKPQGSSIPVLFKGITDPEDLALVEQQTDDLADAYMAIRHEGM